MDAIRWIELDRAGRDRAVEAIATACSRRPEIAAAWLHGSIARGSQGRDLDFGLLTVGAVDRGGIAEEVAAATGLDADQVDVREIETSGPSPLPPHRLQPSTARSPSHRAIPMEGPGKASRSTRVSDQGLSQEAAANPC